MTGIASELREMGLLFIVAEGVIFMLLRLPFLASAARRDWFRTNEPSALFVLSKRPSFTADGKTDATDYA